MQIQKLAKQNVTAVTEFFANSEIKAATKNESSQELMN